MLPLHRTLPSLRNRVCYSNLHPFTPKHLEIHPPSRKFNSVVRCQGSKTQNNGRKNTRRNRRKTVDSFVEDTELTELMKIVELLPKHLRKPLESHPELPNLIEVVMDLGRIPFARFPDGDFDVCKTVVSHADLAYAIKQLGEFGGDSRAGISGTLHRISCMRNRKGEIIGLTARVGRDIIGSADLVADIITEGKSLLLLGYPGRGKTTAIRSMCKILADDVKKRVVIVDTSNEIAGDGDVPHSGIGRARRMQVAHPSVQHSVMIEAVENHMPQVVVIDEIGTEQECQAAATIAQRGVQLIATAHGTGLESVVKNPQLQDLIGGIESVTLGDLEAKRRGVQKTVLERSAPPAFDVAVEMVERNLWRVHHDLAHAVDVLLAGGTARGEMRQKTESGEVQTQEIKRPVPQKLPIPKEDPIEEDQSPKEVEDYSPVAEESDWDFFHDAIPWTAPEVSPDQEDDQMHIFLMGVEPKHLRSILEAMGLEEEIAVTPYLKQANAVLGTSHDLKQAEWVEKAARGAGIPLVALQSSSNMSLAKAIQSLLGLSPSTMESFPPESNSIVKSSLKVTEALKEVKFAIEDIVMCRHQPVDLLPQLPDTMQEQICLIEEYKLKYETVGEGDYTRLRIFPPKD